MILQTLWQRAQQQWGAVQDDLTRDFEDAGLPLSEAVVGRMLRGERRPRQEAREVVRVLLGFFARRRLLYAAEEVEALGEWFRLPPGTALGLMSRVGRSNLDATLVPEVFQRPDRAYQRILEVLGSSWAPYVALEGAPGAGKTTLACHVGLNPLVGSWYDVVLVARPRGEGAFQAADEGELLTALGEFIWTLDPKREPPAHAANAQATLRRLLRGRRALFILDDVADGRAVERLFVRLTDADSGVPNGLLVTVASGTALTDAALHFQRVVLAGWSSEQARSYVGAILDKSLAKDEGQAVEELNEWVDGLPLAWEVLAGLLAYEPDWPGFAGDLQAERIETDRVRAVMDRFYGRLAVDERGIFEALGAFAARAPLGVPAMAQIAGIGEREAREGLRSLHRRHVLRHLGSDRYRAHPLVARFARERLREKERLEELAERHARFYAGRAAPVLERQHEADWPEVVRCLLSDLPNVYRGQAWAAANDHPLAMDYFLRLAPYLSAFREDERWQAWAEAAQEVVETDAAAFPAIERFSLYSQLGWGEGSFERRLAYLQRAHEIAATETEPWVAAYSLTDLARLYLEPGFLVEAEAALLGAWRAAEASEKRYLQAWTLREIGLYYARTLNRTGCDVVVHRMRVDVSHGLEGAYDWASWGEILACVGRWEETLSAFREALTLHEAAGSQARAGELRLQLARCLAHLGREDEACGEIAAVVEELDELPAEVMNLHRLVAGEAARLRGDPSKAVEHLSAALFPAGEGTVFGWRVEFDAWLNLGQALQALGREAEAESALASAQELAARDRQPFWLWEVNRFRWISERQTDSPPLVSELLSVLCGTEEGAPPASTG